MKDNTYESMAKVGETVMNDTNFCGVIAVATACRVSFGKARAELKKQGRRDKKGSPLPYIERATKRLGYEAKLIASWGDKMPSTLNIAKAYPVGVYYVLMNSHIFTMVNGRINDWMKERIDTKGARARSRVYRVYQITQNKGD